MPFQKFTREQYRALDADQLSKRKADVEEELRSGTVPTEDMTAEVDMLTAEYERRNAAVRLHNMRAAQVAGMTGEPIDQKGAAAADADDVTDTTEYRKAFRDLVTRGAKMPVQYRDSANTLTSDVAAAIPTQLVNRIIERMDECGMILPLVNRTSYAGGVTLLKSAVKPVASWVAEGAGSDTQKKSVTSISFSYHKLRCEISMSMEVGTMALSSFEAKFVENVSNAMTIAIEKAILAGTGSGQPKGILIDANVTAATSANRVVTFAGQVPTYEELLAVEAVIPAEFEGTERWFMTKTNFLKVLSMADKNGQPIARVDRGIDGRPERTILGREVVVHPYATEMGSHFAGLVNFADYTLNTIYDMGIQRKQDWDTEDYRAKAVMSVDGQLVDDGSLVIVNAGA